MGRCRRPLAGVHSRTRFPGSPYLRRGGVAAGVAVTLRKRDLVRALEAVPRHPAPVPEMEQYRTPAPIAADLVWAAWRAGGIEDKQVLDLGCGTGAFVLAALLCGAREVVGVDVDRASLGLAQDVVDRTTVAGAAAFVDADLRDWHPEEPFDTVLMNPPFGAQKANRGGDRVFYERAAEALRDRGGAAWFLAQTVGERFLARFIGDLGGEVERVLEWDYPLEAQFAFHERAVQAVRVGGYRARF